VQGARTNCQTPDHVCEVADLPTYETRDGACVNVGAQNGRFLFYRGELTQGTTFPLSIHGTDLRVESALPQNLYVVREGQGAIVPATLGTLVLPALTSSAHMLISGFTRDLQAAGLTQDEARAFMAAWSDSLFGSDSARRDIGRGVPAPESTLLYFLPRADIERLAPMTVTHAVQPGARDGRASAPRDVSRVGCSAHAGFLFGCGASDEPRTQSAAHAGHGSADAWRWRSFLRLHQRFGVTNVGDTMFDIIGTTGELPSVSKWLRDSGSAANARKNRKAASN